MASHDKFIRALTSPNDPLSFERLAEYWVRKNLSAIAAIAMASMMDPVGTAYDLPPLRVVGFESEDVRTLYQVRLHKAAREHRAKDIIQHAIGQHIEDLALFCREQFLTILSTLDVTATFQRDQFAVREER